MHQDQTLLLLWEPITVPKSRIDSHCNRDLLLKSVMARTPNQPGEHLKEEPEALGMSASELARQLDVPPNRLTEIINGERSVTAQTALRLGHWFGTSAAFWLNLQMMYDLRLAEKALGRKLAKLHKRQASSAMAG